MNAENEQLRRLLRLRLGAERAGNSQSDLRLTYQTPTNSLPQPSMAVDVQQCQPIVNVDQRGGNITDVGRDVHNHVHNHWVAISIRFVRLVIVVYKTLTVVTICSGGNTIA